MFFVLSVVGVVLVLSRFGDCKFDITNHKFALVFGPRQIRAVDSLQCGFTRQHCRKIPLCARLRQLWHPCPVEMCQSIHQAMKCRASHPLCVPT